MKDLIQTVISEVASRVKFIQIKQLVAVVLSAFLLLSSTACAPKSLVSDSPDSHKSPSNPYANQRGESSRDLYGTTQKYQGGMNKYADDPKYDNQATKADAQQRVEQAKQNLEKRATSPGDIIDNAKSGGPFSSEARAKTADRIQDATADVRDDLVEGTQKGTRNLKANAERARESVVRGVDDATDNIQENARDAREGLQDLGRGT